MYDDPVPDPFDFNDADIDDSLPSTKGRSCLAITLTLIIIAGLVFSSVLTYFVYRKQDERRARVGVLPESSVLVAGPTAAPATVVAAAAAQLPTSPAEPSSLPTVNRIAVINQDGQIETMSPFGDDRRVLTLESDQTSFQFPTWSPDDKQVAIIGTRAMSGAIYVLNDAARTGTLRDHQIYYSANEPPIYLFWSPDNQNLGFLANRPRNSLSLNVIAGDGNSDSRQLASGNPFYWDWSDDGRQILAHAGGRGADNTLAVIDLDGQAGADNLAIPGVFQAPGIGRNGRYWAFAEESEGGLSSLVVVDTQTGERSTHQQVGSTVLSWSPTRDQIAFTKGAISGHPFWGPLSVLDVATGKERVISTQAVLAFFWSPDGRQIAFITIGDNVQGEDIYAGTMEKSRAVGRLVSLPEAQFGQGFLTLSVFDIEAGEGLRLLNFEPTLPYLAQFLPYFDQYALSHRIWSPDSQAIVLPVRQETGNSILIVPTIGGRPYPLAAGDIAFWSHN
ncbi:MAG: PD40 domain-containing protein [Candidatus Promineofilum sp.]|nr:PD40 domain-containing protein [Promineifilum sp.]